MIMSEQAGIPVPASIPICDAFKKVHSAVCDTVRASTNVHKSHHAGAVSFASFAQIMVLTTHERFKRNTQKEKI